MSSPATENSTAPPPQVVMLSGDLMFASRVKSAAQNADLVFALGGALPEGPLEQVRFVIVDLGTRSGVTTTIALQCAQRCPQAKLIAFGPHVQVAKLQAAHEAGIPTVMTNGQFDRALATLFR